MTLTLISHKIVPYPGYWTMKQLRVDWHQQKEGYNFKISRSNKLGFGLFLTPQQELHPLQQRSRRCTELQTTACPPRGEFPGAQVARTHRGRWGRISCRPARRRWWPRRRSGRCRTPGHAPAAGPGPRPALPHPCHCPEPAHPSATSLLAQECPQPRTPGRFRFPGWRWPPTDGDCCWI